MLLIFKLQKFPGLFHDSRNFVPPPFPAPIGTLLQYIEENKNLNKIKLETYRLEMENTMRISAEKEHLSNKSMSTSLIVLYTP